MVSFDPKILRRIGPIEIGRRRSIGAPVVGVVLMPLGRAHIGKCRGRQCFIGATAVTVELMSWRELLYCCWSCSQWYLIRALEDCYFLEQRPTAFYLSQMIVILSSCSRQYFIGAAAKIVAYDNWPMAFCWSLGWHYWVGAKFDRNL